MKKREASRGIVSRLSVKGNVPLKWRNTIFELISNVLPRSLFDICRKIVSGGYGRRRERVDLLDGVLLGNLTELKIGRTEIVPTGKMHILDAWIQKNEEFFRRKTKKHVEIL